MAVYKLPPPLTVARVDPIAAGHNIVLVTLSAAPTPEQLEEFEAHVRAFYSVDFSKKVETTLEALEQGQ